MSVYRQSQAKALLDLLGPSFIGLEHLVSKFDIDPTSNFPPYDIEKINENLYRITLAVAGFKQSQLEITSHEGTLSVVGTKAVEDEIEQGSQREEILHKGIASRSFDRRFTLGEYMEVNDVTLADGLLVINIARNIPDSAQPKKFDIK